MITLTYEGIDNSLWRIVGPQQGAEGVIAGKVSGFVSDAGIALESAPARAGEVPSGMDVKSFTGTLELSISPQVFQAPGPLDAVVFRLARAWSQYQDGELRWIDERGELLRTRARLSDPWPTLERSPGGFQEVMATLSLSVRCLDGVWKGPTMRYAGPSTVVNRGDLHGYPRVEWSGSAAKVAGPGITEFTLPATSQPAVWDTDPATGGLVTIAGAPATALRQQLRGRVAPSPILPRRTAAWTFTGCAGLMTPAYLNPWGR